VKEAKSLIDQVL